jgi:hypothetical protein
VYLLLIIVLVEHSDSIKKHHHSPFIINFIHIEQATMGARTVLHKSCLKRAEVDNGLGRSAAMKNVFFDEVMIKEYLTILGDNPAVYVFL